MRPGTLVYAARVTEAGVEVVAERIVRPGKYGTQIESGFVPTQDLHATRTAALEALAERLEEEGKRERKTAAEHVTRAERCFINAERARRMAEGEL